LDLTSSACVVRQCRWNSSALIPAFRFTATISLIIMLPQVLRPIVFRRRDFVASLPGINVTAAGGA
jgi:hypothetical protein